MGTDPGVRLAGAKRRGGSTVPRHGAGSLRRGRGWLALGASALLGVASVGTRLLLQGGKQAGRLWRWVASRRRRRRALSLVSAMVRIPLANSLGLVSDGALLVY